MPQITYRCRNHLIFFRIYFIRVHPSVFVVVTIYKKKFPIRLTVRCIYGVHILLANVMKKRVAFLDVFLTETEASSSSLILSRIN